MVKMKIAKIRLFFTITLLMPVLCGANLAISQSINNTAKDEHKPKITMPIDSSLTPKAKTVITNPQYESCKNVNFSTVKEEKKDMSLCFACNLYRSNTSSVAQVKAIKHTIEEVKAQEFRAKLQKRVIGQIKARLFQVQILKACVAGDRSWFANNEDTVDWSMRKVQCQKFKEVLNNSIEENWPKMMVHLALSKPTLKEDRILSDRATWFDQKPSHIVSDFEDLPNLTKEEYSKAEDLYLQALDGIPLEGIKNSELKRKIYNKRSIGSPVSSLGVFLTHRDRQNIRAATKKLQAESKRSYLKTIENMPLLAYLKNGKPNEQDLKEALSKVENKLQNFIEQAKDSDVGMEFLLSFNPLVEELLKEDAGYCLAVKKARMELDNDNIFKNRMNIGLGVLASIPCLIGGPVGITICLAGGVALAGIGYHQAMATEEESLNRFLTGKQFESIAELKLKGEEKKIALLLLPLAAIGKTPTSQVSGMLSSGAVKVMNVGGQITFKGQPMTVLGSITKEGKKYIRLTGSDFKDVLEVPMDQALNKGLNEVILDSETPDGGA